MNVARGIRRRWSRLKGRVRRKFWSQNGWIQFEHLGFQWKLEEHSCISQVLVEGGIWEPVTIRLIQQFVKPGMCVLDVGANFGYFTLLLARAVGTSGTVLAFEPVARFRQQLKWHVEKNQFDQRVRIIDYGLSEHSETTRITVGDSSATLHPSDPDSSEQVEEIVLHPLDRAVEELGIRGADFIKLDIDGHEPQFLRGASRFLQKYHPPIALEFAQHCLHAAGSNVLQQACLLHQLGYVICHEKTYNPYSTEIEFLRECGNYDHSCNALALHSSALRTGDVCPQWQMQQQAAS